MRKCLFSIINAPWSAHQAVAEEAEAVSSHLEREVLIFAEYANYNQDSAQASRNDREEATDVTAKVLVNEAIVKAIFKKSGRSKVKMF